MSADLYFTSVSSSIFFFSPPNRNSTKTGHMVGSKCNLKTHVGNLRYPSPYKSGAQKHLFGATSQHNGNFNGLYLRNETQYRQSVKTTTMGLLYIVPKRHELWSTNGFKLDLHFYPPSENSAFCFIARLRRRKSPNETRPNFAR